MILQKFFEQLAALVEYVGSLMKKGIPVYDEDQDYDQHARVIGSDGKLYKALVANGKGISPAPNQTDPVAETADPRKAGGGAEGDRRWHNGIQRHRVKLAGR